MLSACDFCSIENILCFKTVFDGGSVFIALAVKQIDKGFSLTKKLGVTIAFRQRTYFLDTACGTDCDIRALALVKAEITFLTVNFNLGKSGTGSTTA